MANAPINRYQVQIVMEDGRGFLRWTSRKGGLATRADVVANLKDIIDMIEKVEASYVATRQQPEPPQ